MDDHHDLFVATTEPHGRIEVTVHRATDPTADPTATGEATT